MLKKINGKFCQKNSEIRGVEIRKNNSLHLEIKQYLL